MNRNIGIMNIGSEVFSITESTISMLIESDAEFPNKSKTTKITSNVPFCSIRNL